jgi:hypothetical protein
MCYRLLSAFFRITNSQARFCFPSPVTTKEMKDDTCASSFLILFLLYYTRLVVVSFRQLAPHADRTPANHVHNIGVAIVGSSAFIVIVVGAYHRIGCGGRCGRGRCFLDFGHNDDGNKMQSSGGPTACTTSSSFSTLILLCRIVRACSSFTKTTTKTTRARTTLTAVALSFVLLRLLLLLLLWALFPRTTISFSFSSLLTLCMSLLIRLIHSFTRQRHAVPHSPAYVLLCANGIIGAGRDPALTSIARGVQRRVTPNRCESLFVFGKDGQTDPSGEESRPCGHEPDRLCLPVGC